MKVYGITVKWKYVLICLELDSMIKMKEINENATLLFVNVIRKSIGKKGFSLSYANPYN